MERLYLSKLGIVLHLSELSSLCCTARYPFPGECGWELTAQQVIGCSSWKSRKRVFVGIYSKKVRTNGNGCWVIIFVHSLLRGL